MASNVVSRLRGVKSSQAIKVPCRVATTTNITLSGEQTIDGVAVTAAVAPTPPTRVLVKNQTTASENGIYEVSTGAWRRAPDWDDVGDIVTGTSVRVTAGLIGPGRWVVTTSGTIVVNTTSVTIAAETVSFSDVLNLGAAGDGTTNDTTILSSAFNNSSLVIIPPGTYLVDPITIANPVHILMHPGAVIKRRSATSGAASPLLSFAAGADGSLLEGGMINGDRDTLDGGYVQPFVWSEFYIANCDRVTVRDVRIINATHQPFWVASGRGHHVSNLEIEDCGNAGIFQFVDDSTLRDIRVKDIGNNGVVMYQHAFELRELNRCTIEELSIDGYEPDADGVDPFPVAYAIERVFNCSIGKLFLDGYDGTETRNFGAQISNAKDCTFRDLDFKNAFWGVEFQTATNCTLVSTKLHGNWKTHVSSDGAGIVFKSGGVFQNDGAAVAYDTRANAPSHGVTVIGGEAVGFEVGADVNGPGIKFIGTKLHANRFHGIQLRELATNGFMTGSPAQRIYDVELIGVDAQFNGFNGILAEAGHNVLVNGGKYKNNGWDTSLGVTFRAGVNLAQNAAYSGITNFHITGKPDCGDDQTWTDTDGVSFEPGTTDADDQYYISLLNPSRYNVGQWITLANANGSGDVVVRILSLNLDEALVQCSAPVTFSSTGNTSALTGTLSSSSNTVTGSGTAFEDEVIGAAWLISDGQTIHTARVNSDTQIIVYPAPSPALSADSAVAILIDGEGIPSQQYAVVTSAAVTGPVSVDVLADGVGTGKASIAAAGSLDDGADHYRAGAAVVTTAGTAAGAIVTIDGTQTLSNKTIPASNITSTFTAYVPTVSASSGAFGAGSPTVNTARYAQIGKHVFVDIDISMPANVDTAAGALIFTLPVTAAAGFYRIPGVAIVHDTGNMGTVTIQSTTTVGVLYYNALTVIVNSHRVYASLRYEAA